MDVDVGLPSSATAAACGTPRPPPGRAAAVDGADAPESQQGPPPGGAAVVPPPGGLRRVTAPEGSPMDVDEGASSSAPLHERPNAEGLLAWLHRPGALGGAEGEQGGGAACGTVHPQVDVAGAEPPVAPGRDRHQQEVPLQAPPKRRRLPRKSGPASEARRRAELLAEREQVLQQLREATEGHARYRREVAQGGSIPSHFVTLTTACYQWADLARVLEEYERCTTANREGAQDPCEPGEDRLTPEKRRVMQYPGVVAWFCALKLEMYARYVLDYEDLFGVFEWGSGGIVHLHMLGWRFPGLGRYDLNEGAVPLQQRKEDARLMACQHGAEISE